MSKIHSLIGRREFLVSSALAGVVGAFLPRAIAHAETTPAATGSAEALEPAATSAPANATLAGATVIGAAAAAQPSGDTSIRPFHFHAPDESFGRPSSKARHDEVA